MTATESADTTTWASKVIDLELASGASTNVELTVPVTTLFELTNVKSPTVKYQNNNLEICGGIPIADNIQLMYQTLYLE